MKTIKAILLHLHMNEFQSANYQPQPNYKLKIAEQEIVVGLEPRGMEIDASHHIMRSLNHVGMIIQNLSGHARHFASNTSLLLHQSVKKLDAQTISFKEDGFVE